MAETALPKIRIFIECGRTKVEVDEASFMKLLDSNAVTVRRAKRRIRKRVAKQVILPREIEEARKVIEKLVSNNERLTRELAACEAALENSGRACDLYNKSLLAAREVVQASKEALAAFEAAESHPND